MVLSLYSSKLLVNVMIMTVRMYDVVIVIYIYIYDSVENIGWFFCFPGHKNNIKQDCACLVADRSRVGWILQWWGF